MEKWELQEIIDTNTVSLENYRAIMDAVEAYSSASNNGNAVVSGALPQEIEDACVKFGIYVYAHNCNVDEAEVNVELVKEDYKRYLAGRQ